MPKKHRCMRCGTLKKVKKMSCCSHCNDIMCKNCFTQETNNIICYDCSKIKKAKKLQYHVRELIKCIDSLNQKCLKNE